MGALVVVDTGWPDRGGLARPPNILLELANGHDSGETQPGADRFGTGRPGDEQSGHLPDGSVTVGTGHSRFESRQSIESPPKSRQIANPPARALETFTGMVSETCVAEPGPVLLAGELDGSAGKGDRDLIQ